MKQNPRQILLERNTTLTLADSFPKLQCSVPALLPAKLGMIQLGFPVQLQIGSINRYLLSFLLSIKFCLISKPNNQNFVSSVELFKTAIITSQFSQR